jgi:predicted metal-dependent hydrolase
LARRELLKIEGRAVEVNVRLNPRARRLIVKVHPSTGEISVVAPSQRALDRALTFAQGQSDWIAHQLSRVPAPVALGIGAELPLRGEPHVVRQGQSGHGAVWIEDRQVHVSGAREHHARRLLEFGKRIGTRHARITVRDTASRWGSCSAGRSLSFSWRLILAPPFVLDYVVAHEVAHMREMNHGAKFWRLVEELIGDPRRAQTWLRDHGASLHRYAPKS